MAESIDGMFEKVPFDEAYQTTIQHDKQFREYKAQGAVLNGERPLDKQYTAFSSEAVKYQMQFNENELMALMERACEENNPINYFYFN